jgi:predicted DNA-binding protein
MTLVVTTMLSLRLTAEQEQRLKALASRQRITRSQWLRAAIERQMAAEDAALDGHAVYLVLTEALPGAAGSGRRDGARRHSEVLKQKLHASRRR